MYKTNFVCTYKAFEELADDEVNSDMLYQAQFLQVFGIVEYDDDAISAGLEFIKAKVIEIPELMSLVLRHPYRVTFNSDDSDSDSDSDSLEMLLPLMFAYPLMDVFHLCLIDAFKTGSISTVARDNVLNAYKTLD